MLSAITDTKNTKKGGGDKSGREKPLVRALIRPARLPLKSLKTSSTVLGTGCGAPSMQILPSLELHHHPSPEPSYRISSLCFSQQKNKKEKKKEECGTGGDEEEEE